MARKIKTTEEVAITTVEMALQNARTQPEIAAALLIGGYDEDKLKEGDQILANLKTAFNTNKQEDDETFEARIVFKTGFAQLQNNYADYRKVARVVFRKDEVAWQKLKLYGRISQTYGKWNSPANVFCEVMNSNTAYQDALANFFPAATWTQFKTDLDSLAQKYVDYNREMAESQAATKEKDAAFDEMNEWIDDFYEVAQLTLEDKPQLLEALGLFVRS